MSQSGLNDRTNYRKSGPGQISPSAFAPRPSSIGGANVPSRVAPRVPSMKILSVNNTADLYGASRCMERVFGELAQQGHEVHALLPEGGPLVNLLESRGVHVHVHPGLTLIDRNRLKTLSGCLRFAALFPLSVFFLVRLILRLRIDVVHTNTVVLPSPSLAALLTRRPHVWHVRELLQEFGSFWRPYQHCVAWLSSEIVAISASVRDQFDAGLRPKVQIVYDGLDESMSMADTARVQAFRARFPAGALLVGVVGRIKWHRKGQEVLVRAASLLRERHPATHYVVVGSPSRGNEDHEVRLRELIRQCHLEDVVHLVGEMEDTASVFAALDVAVVPSVQPEPFGCVVLEAMAAGTAVIGSRAGGIAEQIVHGETGLLFTPGDAEDLAQQLEKLLGSPALREGVAAAGKRHGASHFRLATTVRRMAELFARLQAGRPLLQVSMPSAE